MDKTLLNEHFEDEPQAEELHEILQSNNEPVAWLINGYLSDEEFRTSELDVIIPLYTHPAKTLTDEEILNICWQKGITWWKLSDVDMDEQTMIEFARAILRKAQEK